MQAWIGILIALAAVALLTLSIRIVKQWEKGVILRFGRLISIRNPGFNLMLPGIDRMIKVDLRIVTMVLDPQEVITRDNVTIKVDAVVYFKVVNAESAVVAVEEHQIDGGVGSAVIEVLAEEYPVPVERVGMPNSFGESGQPRELIAKYGMDKDAIVRAVLKVVRRKK